MKKAIPFYFLALAVAIFLAYLWFGGDAPASRRIPSRQDVGFVEPDLNVGTATNKNGVWFHDTAPKAASAFRPHQADNKQSNIVGKSQPVGDENAEAEEDRLVEAFDNFTDRWMKPQKDRVSLKDVRAFVGQFGKVPKKRKKECLQRALNLIPDENVMLLVGILMDKTQEKELVRLVFDDILNRDENAKRTILTQIFKDREHSCWSDAAWILEATGDRPNQK